MATAAGTPKIRRPKIRRKIGSSSITEYPALATPTHRLTVATRSQKGAHSELNLLILPGLYSIPAACPRQCSPLGATTQAADPPQAEFELQRRRKSRLEERNLNILVLSRQVVGSPCPPIRPKGWCFSVQLCNPRLRRV